MKTKLYASLVIFGLIGFHIGGSTAWGSGYSIFDFYAHDDSAHAVTLLPGGNIIAVGEVNNGSNVAFGIMKMTPSGSLDSSFSGNGKKMHVVTSHADGRAQSVTWDSLHKRILVGGAQRQVEGMSEGIVVLAMDKDGKMDDSFNSDGQASVTFSPNFTSVSGHSVSADRGNVTVAGRGDDAMAVLRFTSMGNLDASFSGDGQLITPFSVGASSNAYKHVQQKDSKILLIGRAYDGTHYNVGLQRMDASGKVDEGFGNKGEVMTLVGSENAFGRDGFVDSENRILVAGYALNGSDYDVAILRYDSIGRLDSSFGEGGVFTGQVTSGKDDAVVAVANRPDGRMVVAGGTYNGTNWDAFLGQVTPEGKWDVSFGEAGVARFPITVGNQFFWDVELQPDGKAIAVGEAYNGSHKDFLIARYLTNGALDPTFGSGGVTPPVTASLTPVADTYAFQNSPTANYGKGTQLRVSSRPNYERNTYLKFDLSFITGEVLEAKLTLYPNSSSSVDHELCDLSSADWTETGLNYKNAPTCIEEIAQFSPKAHTPVTIDVTGWVSRSLTTRSEVAYGLRATKPNAATMSYSSKEGTQYPQLRVTYRQ